MISFAVPFFKDIIGLNRLIESILEQDCEVAFEIVIFDDSPKVLVDCELWWLQDDRIKIVDLLQNFGPYRSNILAYLFCKYDLIIHFDQDDFFVARDSLTNLHNFYLNNDFPVVFSSSVGARGAGFIRKSGVFRDIVSKAVPVVHSGSMYNRRDLLAFADLKLGKRWIDLDKYRIILGTQRFGVCEGSIVSVSFSKSSLTNFDSSYQVDILGRVLVNRLLLRLWDVDSFRVVMAILKSLVKRFQNVFK